MAIYSNTITAPATLQTEPSFVVPFEPKSIVVINENDTVENYVEVSFDGINVHGKLIPTVVPGLRFEQRVQKIWVMGEGSPTVRIIAEA